MPVPQPAPVNVPLFAVVQQQPPRPTPTTESASTVPAVTTTSATTAPAAPEREHDYTYPTLDLLKGAIDALPEWTDKTEMAKAVADHVKGQLQAAAAQGRKPLVLIGEGHDIKASLAIKLSVLKAVHDVHGPGATVLIETSPQFIKAYKDSADAFATRLRTDPSSAEKRIDHADSAIRMTAHVDAALVVASQLGYESAPFDSEWATGSRSKRENGMVESIQSWANATDKPTIVIAGATSPVSAAPATGTERPDRSGVDERQRLQAGSFSRGHPAL